MKYLRYLLIFVPLTFIAVFAHWSETFIFIGSCLAIVPLAGYLGVATEEIAAYTGPKFGGFLNATFGNATELIISIFALVEGNAALVRQSLAGSVLGNILLVLGCSIFFGGLRHKELKFDAKAGSFTGSMLLFAIVGLSLPTIFTMTQGHISSSELSSKPHFENFSVIVAAILLVIYIIGLVYSFKTQEDLYGVEHAEDVETTMKLPIAILVLGLSTVLIAFMSDYLVESITPMTESAGIPQAFIGLIIVPIVGNVAEHSTAVIMALKNKMDISIEIAVGSSLQISLFVLPVIVILSLFFSPIALTLEPIELFIFFASVLVANQVVSSGRTNWVEGLKMMMIYVIAGAGFFLIT
ncbi:MAG: calcium/proton exchanger [Oscillospiraceae bacterium]